MSLISRARQEILNFYWSVTRCIGLEKIHGREMEVLRDLPFYPFYPIFFVVAHLIQRTAWRFVEAPLHGRKAIGHLALDYDCLFKDLILENRQVKILLIGDVGPVANDALFALWSPRMTVVKSSVLRDLAKRLVTWFPSVKVPIDHYCHFVRGPASSHLVQQKWGKRPPIVQLSEADIARGEARLLEMGIPLDAWFVCVHNREPGYAPQNEWASSHRNSDITTYVEAMKLIVERGGFCVRMGDHTMKTLPPMEGVVDYAHSAFKEDWMDIFLCARCRFFLGTSSGLFVIAGIFGKPSALTNHSPVSSIYTAFPQDLSISKLYADEEGKLIPFDVLFGTHLSEYRYSYEFENCKITWIDNSAEEIADLAAEMMERLDADASTTPDNELQAAFRALMKPHHYGWYSKSQVAASFLERHRDLLPQDITHLKMDGSV